MRRSGVSILIRPDTDSHANAGTHWHFNPDSYSHARTALHYGCVRARRRPKLQVMIRLVLITDQ